MKAEIIETETNFQPVALKLTIETAKEYWTLRQLAAIDTEQNATEVLGCIDAGWNYHAETLPGICDAIAQAMIKHEAKNIVTLPQ